MGNLKKYVKKSCVSLYRNSIIFRDRINKINKFGHGNSMLISNSFIFLNYPEKYLKIT